jgi:GDPmannose 4,6-dehydratase
METRAQKTALVTGVGGQDGAYLADLLLARGYRVVGTSRDARGNRFDRLVRLGIRHRVAVETMSPVDFRSTLDVVARERPDEIYNLAGQSSVAISFERPVETFESIVVGTINLLEAIRILGLPTRLFNAGSSEMFGDTAGDPATETSAIRPRSPYGIAKATAHWQVAQYRAAYGIHACTGILFNHESPLRSERFVTQKIVAAACRIAAGEQDSVELGNLAVSRDWGWAAEYVAAMHGMLQLDEPEDLVIATGTTATLQDFVEQAFATVGLNWRRHVRRDEKLLRPNEIASIGADPSRAWRRLGWRAHATAPDVARMMVESRRPAATPPFRRAA